MSNLINRLSEDGALFTAREVMEIVNYYLDQDVHKEQIKRACSNMDVAHAARMAAIQEQRKAGIERRRARREAAKSGE